MRFKQVILSSVLAFEEILELWIETIKIAN